MNAISEDTMNDRELLELAAKAAGIEIVPCTCHYEQWPFKYAEGQGKSGHWNPLHDDGDALRLAMHLGFTVEPGRCWHSPYGPAFGEDVLDGELKSTRRAIVRAAAEIGRSMP